MTGTWICRPLFAVLIIKLGFLQYVGGQNNVHLSLCWDSRVQGGVYCGKNVTPRLGEKDGAVICTLQRSSNGRFFKWRFNGKTMLPTGTNITLEATRSSLFFPPMETRFQGTYSCHVETDEGMRSATLDMKLHKGNQLPMPAALKFPTPGRVSVPIRPYSPPIGTPVVNRPRSGTSLDDPDFRPSTKAGNSKPKGTANGVLEGSFFKIVIAIPILVILCCVVNIARGLMKILLCLLPEQKDNLASLAKEELADFLNEWGYVRFVETPMKLRYDPAYEIDPLNLRIEFDNILGIGEFGKVYKGQLHQEGTFANSPVPVAVKTVKDDVDVNHFKALLEEVKLLIHVGSHRNLVRLVGVYSKSVQSCKLWFVMEFCENGSLLQYIRRHQNRFVNLVEEGTLRPEKLKGGEVGEDISTSEYLFHTGTLFKWIMDIASGLDHVHGKMVIHGDIAARNILLSESLVPKISDFGLARQLTSASDYAGMDAEDIPLPWRYMAPESLGNNRKFTKKSDVWSFGVTIWEIFSLGATPYDDKGWGMDFLQSLKDGMRLQKPHRSTGDIFEFISRCWELEKTCRPNVADVIPICVTNLRNIQRFTSEYYQYE